MTKKVFFLSIFFLLACPSLLRHPWTGDPSGCFTFIRIHFHLFVGFCVMGGRGFGRFIKTHPKWPFAN
jgi:hypothetical protein